MRRIGVLGWVVGVGSLVACSRGDAIQTLHPPPIAAAPPVPGPRLAPVSTDGQGSSIALARFGEHTVALVADADGKAVRAVDTRTNHELAATALSGEPSQLVVARDGRVFVALRDRAEVDVLDTGNDPEPAMRVVGRVATAEEPSGVALTPDGKTLLVTCAWAHALDAFTTRTLEHAFEVDVAREPRAVVTSADGRTAYVSHATASVVTAVDLATPDHPERAVRLEQPDSNGIDGKLAWRQGFALARTEFGMVVPGVTANTGDTTVRSETYGGVDVTSLPAESFDVAVVDEKTDDPMATPRTASAASFTSCLLPRAAAYDASGDWLFVACQGQDAVWRMDVRARGQGSMGSTPTEWKVGAEPTGIAIDPEARAAYVWGQTGRTITSFPLDGQHPASKAADEDGTWAYAFGPIVDRDSPVEVGRDLFHTTGDSRISSDGRACASCHPDGRDDGLVWATPDGPRQTPTLAGRLAGTAPYGWNGSRDTVKKHVTSTITRLGGTGIDDAGMDALVAYCMAMKGPPRAAADRARDTLVAEGRDVFESAGAACSSCHIDDGTFTDGERHDVKSRAPGDPRRSFDTPSLRFVSGTAPYFHDGRYPSLRELLLRSDGKMGHTAQLSPHEIDALEAYLQTL